MQVNQKLYPKVLIIGEPFQKKSGGGITLSNLFKEWPKNRLAVATTRIRESQTDQCEKYYCLGSFESTSFWPFNIYTKNIRSGLVNIDELKAYSAKNVLVKLQTKGRYKSIFNNNIKKYYSFFLRFSSLNNIIDNLKISGKFLEFVDYYNPDIIYSQASSLSIINFTHQLYKIRKIPYVIHIMDDLINVINKPGIFYYYWQYIINRRFKELIIDASLLLSISQAMSYEYKQRYKLNFFPFRNPVEIDLWMPYSKTTWDYKEPFKILHAGRLVPPVSQALFDVCKAIDNLNKNGIKFHLDITTFDNNANFEKKIKNFIGISINKPVLHNEMPQLLSQYDLLLLPIDFNRKGIRYAQYSISTKTTEFLISGVPILVYAPEETAIYKYFSENNLGFVFNKKVDLNRQLLKIKSDSINREKYSRNAIEFAKKTQNSRLICEEFRKILEDIV